MEKMDRIVHSQPNGDTGRMVLDLPEGDSGLSCRDTVGAVSERQAERKANVLGLRRFILTVAT